MSFIPTSFKTQLNDGNYIPIVGLGTISLKKESIRYAINSGYRHFDSAHLYQNEKEIGEAVNEAIKSGKVRREEFYIVSKVWSTYFSKGRIIKSAKQSLQRFGLQYLDLLLLHCPIAFKDHDTDFFPKLSNGDIAVTNYDIVDTYKELEQCKRMGLVKSIGVSNFNSVQIERILKSATIPPVTNQVECHPYLNQERLLNFCTERDITLTAYSPLGKGDKKPSDGSPLLLENETLKHIADRHSKTVAQIIIRWQTQRGVIVIPRSSDKLNIAANLRVFDFTLSDWEMASIDSLNRNYRYSKWNDSKSVVNHKAYPFNVDF